VMIGLGWSGQWSASFVSVTGAIHIQTGMERMHLKLMPVEHIRTPRILLLFWQGHDHLRGHNLLRSFVLAHHTPKPGGQLPKLPVAACSWPLFDTGNKVTENNQIEFASLYFKKNIPIDTFWLDAGWFEGVGPIELATGSQRKVPSRKASVPWQMQSTEWACALLYGLNRNGFIRERGWISITRSGCWG